MSFRENKFSIHGRSGAAADFVAREVHYAG
jgi:hypothetical protein